MSSMFKMMSLSAFCVTIGACTSSLTRDPSSVTSANPSRSASRGPASTNSTCIEGPCNIREIISQEDPSINRQVITPGSLQRIQDLRSDGKERSLLLGANNKLKMNKLQPGERPPWVNQARYFDQVKTTSSTGVVRANATDFSRQIVASKSAAAQKVHPDRNRRYRATPLTAGELEANRVQSVEKEKARKERAAAQSGEVKSFAEAPASVSLCTDDLYESNDYMSSAFDLRSYENTWLSGIRGSGVQNDDDWYKIYVDPSYKHLIVDLRFRDSEGDIDLEVYDAYGAVRASSRGTSDDEYIDVNLSTGGTYYIKVYFGDRCNRYDLLWNTGRSGAASTPSDDYYENNDYRTYAYDLRGRRGAWLSNLYGNGVLFRGDDDWYKIEATAGFSRLILDLRFLHSYGDLDMRLYDDTGAELASSRSVTNDEYIDFVVPTRGERRDFYVQIFSYGSFDYNYYDFRWDALAGGGGTAEDMYEPNDFFAATNPVINEGQAITGTQGDADWYRFYVSDTSRNLQITSTFVDADGDIDIKLFDDAGYELAASRGTIGNSEYINYTVPEGGRYYYVVVYGNNYFNPYRLVWQSSATGPSDDSYEPNDSLAEAFDFSTRENQWLSNVAGVGIQRDAADYFKVYMPPGLETFNFELRYNKNNGLIRYKLLRADGTLLTSAAGVPALDADRLSIVMPSSGYYYIVFTGGSRGNTYDFKWSASGYTRPVEPGSGQKNSVEYYNVDLRHYFMTAEPGEMQSVETGGAGPGWFRTGKYFRVNALNNGSGNDVCRFYGTPGRGPNSHFYTADAGECNFVKADPGWTYEGLVFRVPVPTVNASVKSCATGLVPVYRVYNNGFATNDSNHRYTTDLLVYQDMQSSGWSPEGIVFCGLRVQ